MYNINKFKMEYESIWEPDKTSLDSTGLCLLHIYRKIHRNCLWIHEQMGESPDNNIDFLNNVINRICYDFKINREKIFDISPTGRVKPNRFERFINEYDIPTIYKTEYKVVWDCYSNLSSQLRKEQEKREEENKNSDYIRIVDNFQFKKE